MILVILKNASIPTLSCSALRMTAKWARCGEKVGKLEFQPSHQKCTRKYGLLQRYEVTTVLNNLQP